MVVDIKNGEELPAKVRAALLDDNVIKAAFNANFERLCIGKYFNLPLKIEQWRCTAVLASTLGLPSSLDEVSKVLNLPVVKMKEGRALIKEFSMGNLSQSPLPIIKGCNEKLLQRQELEKEERWKLFKKYCAMDVEVERAIRNKLKDYTLIENEQKLWCLDGKINDYGVKIDEKLLEFALILSRDMEKCKKQELKTLTSLDNPNSPTQLKKWLNEYADIEVKSLSKEKVEILINETEDTVVKRVLSIRREISKTSLKKYEAMNRSLCKDGRIRGLLKFYGANRTGRWSGKLVQVQNLPQTKLKDLALAREVLISGRGEDLEFLYESASNVLSQLIRTAFIPRENCRFIVSDFSAIEARIIAWLAGEKWRMQVFASHGKIYEASASQMFKVPIESITKDSLLRQKGKVAELALGYGGSTGALTVMGATKMGVLEEELYPLVKAWREANPRIVALWHNVEEAAIKALKDKVVVDFKYGIKFYCRDGILFAKLPSGRKLAYFEARLEREEKFNKVGITYKGFGVGKGWCTMRTYGGKLVENIVQAIARDCLAEAMINIDKAGYNIVMHVHDEVVLEVPIGEGSLEEVNEIMGRNIQWAEGLYLRAEGFEANYYRK
ncbi:DNA polymerase [Clostridium sp. DL1XJH146]